MKRNGKTQAQVSQRPLRVGEEVRHALADALSAISFIAPQLEGVSITISQVEMSPDLRHANVFVTPLGYTGEEAQKIIKALNKHSGHFRHEVDTRVALKFSARLKFIYDTSFDIAAKMEDLLRNPDDAGNDA